MVLGGQKVDAGSLRLRIRRRADVPALADELRGERGLNVASQNQGRSPNVLVTLRRYARTVTGASLPRWAMPGGRGR
jgi:hypothetical protein